MSPLRRILAAVGLVLAIFLLSPLAPAHASSTLQECIDQAESHDGEPPTCTEVDGEYEASWPDDVSDESFNDDSFTDDSFSGDEGFGGSFIALFVIVGLIGVGVAVWQVSTARTLAKRSGMDPNIATQMALLTDDGLEATYLAANLRQQTSPPAASTPVPPTVSASQRLTELKGLLDANLITQAEFDERRTAIIAGL